MILEDIKNKLSEIDPNVHYGMVGAVDNETVWDYIVFNRRRRRENDNRTGYSYFYDVHIVRENFIPEDIDLAVTAKMLEIKGMRLAAEDGEYDYIMKPNTNIVLEVLTLHFVKARKNV